MAALATALLHALSPASAAGDVSGGDFTIARSTLVGGGGRSAGGVFEVRSTVAQPDPGDASGGEFELCGGFTEGDPYACEAPAAASNCSASETECDAVVVAWDDNSVDEEGFKIFRNDSLIAVVGVDVTEFADVTAIAGITYDYLVVAASACDDATPSNADSGRRLEPPVSPEGLTVASLLDLGDSLFVDLDWTDLSPDEEIQIVYVFEDAVPAPIDTVAADVEEAQVTLPNTSAEEYCFTVAAVNCDVEASSDSACAMPEVSGVVSPVDAPAVFALRGAEPNPFNPVVRVLFDTPRRSRPDVAIYDVRGRRVAGLVNDPLPAGRHTVTWNGTDAGGRPVSSGVYFVRMKTPGFRDVIRLVLLK